MLFRSVSKFDYVIVNSDISLAMAQLRSIVTGDDSARYMTYSYVRRLQTDLFGQLGII